MPVPSHDLPIKPDGDRGYRPSVAGPERRPWNERPVSVRSYGGSVTIASTDSGSMPAMTSRQSPTWIIRLAPPVSLGVLRHQRLDLGHDVIRVEPLGGRVLRDRLADIDRDTASPVHRVAPLQQPHGR